MGLFGFAVEQVASWAAEVTSDAPVSGPGTTPAFSPSWSPWYVRSPKRLPSEELAPGDSISNAPTPEHTGTGTTTYTVTTRGAFRFLCNDTDGDDNNGESDSETVVPKKPSGAETPQTTVSEPSYYSQTNLSDTNPCRRVEASEVRTQAIEIPAAGGARGNYYPHRFHNYNNEVPNLVNRHPLVEHPLTPNGPYTPGTPPGPARIVVNERDRSTPETMYHDETKPRRGHSRHHPFTKGEYRGTDRSTPTGLEDGFGRMGIWE